MKLTTIVAAAVFLLVADGLLARWAGGGNAVVPALAGGGIALAGQIGAARLARRAFAAPFLQFLRAWTLGIGLRFAAFVALAVVMIAAPATFPPSPTALGFLGVMIPLLLLEIRLTR